jgi:VWFA-related protein
MFEMPRSGYRSSLLLVCLALLEIVPAAQITSDQKSATVPATTDQSSAEPNSTFHAESRLVVVDVVVTKHRDPVPGLTEPDFKVFEDGKPQEIAFFEAHIPPAVNSKRTPGSINIVLFDLLNTPLLDQPYAREQMIQFLKTLPPGQQVALFQLGTTLRMIAGFSATSDELIAAARKVVPHTSELLDTQESRERAQDELAAARDGSPNQEFFDRMQDFMAEATDTRDQDRAKITLQALNDIARAASGFRGRKNIIWLSEEFPVYFGPQFNASDPDPNARNYFEVMRDMGTMLSSAQVSLYPIDVRGLISGLVTASSGGAARGNE